MLECFETQQETLFVQESLSAHATQIWAREVVTSGTLKISTKVHFHFRIVVNIKCGLGFKKYCLHRFIIFKFFVLL